MGQDEQSLPARGQPPLPRADMPAVKRQLASDVPQVHGGQIDCRRVAKHTKLLCSTEDLGRDTVYQELPRIAKPTNWRAITLG
ncbi:hypothetical protein GCM10027028_38450 [Streptomyces sundarbansensis]